MKAFHTLERPVSSLGLRAAIQRVALATVCLVLAACGGSADAPPPPESVPLVITQPADQSVVAGSAAIFSVSASGAAPLSYQWASSPDGITFTDVVGATAASYNTGATTLAPAQAFNAGPLHRQQTAHRPHGQSIFEPSRSGRTKPVQMGKRCRIGRKRVRRWRALALGQMTWRRLVHGYGLDSLPEVKQCLKGLARPQLETGGQPFILPEISHLSVTDVTPRYWFQEPGTAA